MMELSAEIVPRRTALIVAVVLISRTAHKAVREAMAEDENRELPASGR